MQGTGSLRHRATPRHWLALVVLAALASAALAAIALGATGDADGGYGSKGIAVVPVGNAGRSSAAATVMQGDKLIVAGQAAQSTGSGTINRIALTRLNADGSRDTSFGTNGETLVPAGTADSEALGVALAPSGKIVVAGSAATAAAIQVAVARFDANGRPDGGFGTGGVVLASMGDGGNAVGQGVVVQPDERVVVAGTALDGGANKAFVMRLGSTGGVEAWGGLTTAGDGTDTRATAIARLGDGSYAVAGRASETGTKLLVARYAEGTGALTGGWGTAGTGVTLRALGDGETTIGNAIAVSGDRIVAAGSATDASRTKAFVARFLAGNGQPDPGFGSAGATLTAIGSSGTSEANGVAVAGDGKVLTAGNATDDVGGVALSQFAAARYRSDGQLDTTFAPGSALPGTSLVAAAGQPAYGDALAVQGDGKLIVAGRVGDGDGETVAATRFCSTDAQGCTGTGTGAGGGSGGSGGGAGELPPFECGKVVTFGIIEAEGCLRETNGRWEATGRLMVNGLTLQPEARSTIILDTKARRLYIDGPGDAAGQVTARLGSITIFENLPLDVRLPSLSVDRVSLPDLELSRRGSVFGFPLTGKADAALVKAGIQITVQVGLPKIFGGVTGSISLKADMKNGFRPDGLRITANEALLGPLKVKDLLISYDDTDRLWQGQATVFLLPFPYGATGAVAVKDGGLKTLVAGIDGLNVAVGPGVFLQRIAFGIGVDPFTIIGGVGFTAGPEVGGISAVRIDGNFRLVFPGSPAARIELSTNAFCQLSSCVPGASQAGGDGLKVVNIPLAGFSFSADTDGQIAFGGHIGYDVAIASLDASVDGWIDGDKGFNVEGNGRVCVFTIACAGAEAVFSSEGLGVCGYVVVLGARVAVGFGIRWPDDIRVMAGVCDISPFRATKSSLLMSGLSAFAAQDSAPQVVKFAGGKQYGIVRLTGSTGAPSVVVSGPGGEQVATPADPSPGIQSGRFMVLKDSVAKQTTIVIAKPGSAGWTITPQPGSSPIASIQQADPLPAPSIKAKVTGSGYQRRLSYTVRHIDGQSVRFAEVGGGVTHVLGTTTKTHGVISFAPRDGRKGKRKIEAVVLQGGLPRRSLTAATYTAPARRLPGRPGTITARRTATRLTVSWKPATHVDSYRVRVAVSDGRRLLFDATRSKRRISVPSFKRTDAATITVTPLMKSLRRGHSRTAKLKAGKPARKRR